MAKKSRPYREGLLESLRDPLEAASYVNAALDDSQDMLLVALRDVADARGMTAVAEGASVSRESIYRMLTELGNPTYASLSRILKTLGLGLKVEALGSPAIPEKILEPEKEVKPASLLEQQQGGSILGNSVSDACSAAMGNLDLSKILGLRNVAAHIPNIGLTVADALGPMRDSSAAVTSLNAHASAFAELNKQVAAFTENMAGPLRGLASIAAAHAEWMKSISGMDDREPEADQALESNERKRLHLVPRREPSVSGINPTSRPETQFQKSA